jgi:hypothetical protein
MKRPCGEAAGALSLVDSSAATAVKLRLNHSSTVAYARANSAKIAVIRRGIVELN